MSAAPRLLWPGSDRDPLVVVRSSFWGYNSIGLFGGDEACVIDPGIYPEDIALLERALAEREGTDRGAAPRRITRVVLTHSHHDHIRGWMHFPGARTLFPRVAAEKTEAARERILAAKNVIDEKLGIEAKDFRYPTADEVFDAELTFTVGSLDVELRFLPGHSNCTSVVWIPALRTLCSADYLVSPGLPYCRWTAGRFEEALQTIRRWVDEDGIERIVPSHFAPLVGRAAVLAAIETESDYFRALRQLVRSSLAQGLDAESSARRAAAAMDERRPESAGARARQDLDNARRVVAEEA
ncbi:MAG: MBL fold metallo-hydrolase [bacterium]|nr:MBL fold metallo-hydrolase [bacterium]